MVTSPPILLRIERVKFPNRALVRNPLTGRSYEIKNAKMSQLLRCRFRGQKAFCQVIEAAPFEGESFCEHSADCGGCYYPRYSVEQQLVAKVEMVRDLLGKEIGEVIPSPASTAYRNKMEYSFGDLSKGGEMTLGMHRIGRHHDVVSVPGCRLTHPDFELIRSAVLEYAKSSGFGLYQKSGDKSGFYRHLVVRRSEASGDLLIGLSAASDPRFDREGFCRMLLALPLSGRIAGVVWIRNDGIADVSAGAAEVLYGENRIVERILGIAFSLSIGDFFQTNSLGAERLYRQALHRLDEVARISERREPGLFLDLFCGTGTIGQIAAARFRNLRVIGVDIVESAIVSARENAKRNGIEAEFIAGDVFDVLNRQTFRPDFVVVDPPRAGIGIKAIDRIAAFGIPAILYISCNPVTLKQDLEQFEAQGYETDRVDLCDMFPMTSGIEAICVLRRGSADRV